MILCCGEALIDMLPRRTSGGEAAFVPHPGGSVFNTAVALGRLGAPAGFFSALSRDMFGAMLRDALAASGVDLRYAVQSERPTTLAFVHLSDGEASYAFYDEGSAGRMISEHDLPAVGADVEALFFGGISLVPEPCASTYETLMRRPRGARVAMLDPNIRPAFVTDETAYRNRIARMIAMADIVKLSDADLAWLEGDDSERTARALLERGPSLAVITRGANGATAYTTHLAVHAAPARAAVVDTVGAGDVFNAGLLCALRESGRMSRTALGALARHDLEAALGLASAAAAATVSRPGADPPRRTDLQ